MGCKAAADLFQCDRRLANIVSAVEVWEDAVDRGYATRQPVQGRTIVVTTELGQQFLREHGR